MNQLLHDYVRSGHFSMNLSERQIEVLLILNAVGYGGWLAGKLMPNAGSAGVVQLLKLGSKGLISKDPDPNVRGWTVTRAGQLVSSLLLEAGFKVPEIYNEYKGSECNGTTRDTSAVA